MMGQVQLRATVEQWPLIEPFAISGRTFTSIDLLVVELEADGLVGRGEAAGVYYHDDTPHRMLHQVEDLRDRITSGIDRDELQQILPMGGARNAIDCALWELNAKQAATTVWQLAGFPQPRPIVTVFGCGADTPESMARVAGSYEQARAIKLKLTGDPIDADRVRAVRDRCPDVWLAVDANQGFTRPFFDQLMPILVDADVKLVEQPFPVGQEALLDGLDSPIDIAADESVLGVADLDALVGRFTHANIKLDKCGGLTHALDMIEKARRLGIELMVGNMFGTSLGMAPAFLVGQSCSVVDLDGPLFLRADRSARARYYDGQIFCSDEIWGESLN